MCKEHYCVHNMDSTKATYRQTSYTSCRQIVIRLTAAWRPVRHTFLQMLIARAFGGSPVAMVLIFVIEPATTPTSSWRVLRYTVVLSKTGAQL